MNLLLLAALGCVWLGLRASTPERMMTVAHAPHMAALEDAFAQNPDSVEYAEELADLYLARGYGELAVVALRRADHSVLEQPRIALRLARAYENTGRLLDALATSDLALDRCGRVLGTRSAQTPTPAYGCTQATYASIDMHKGALERMVRWGIVDPRTDPRARRAYQLALRRARIALGVADRAPAAN